MQNIENYLNQLLSSDTIIFSLALRTLFSFGYLRRKERKNKKEKKGEDNSQSILSRNKRIESAFDYEDKNNMTSLDQNQILDTDGQLDDYFTADKNPFARMGESGSLDELGQFLVKKGSRQQTGEIA